MYIERMFILSSMLMQGISFLMVILVAYLLKKGDLFKKSDGNVLSRIIVNLTLPATIILGFDSIEINSTLFMMIFLGFISNVLLVSIGGVIWKGRKSSDQALMMFGQAGYNIGNFVIPFVQGFFPEAIPLIGSFDTGNSLMVSGGNAILVDRFTESGEAELNIKKTLKGLFSSPPFTTYIVMILLAVVNLRIPTSVLSIVELLASANAFLAMFMIGLFLEINISRSDLKNVLTILLTRYGLGIILALFFYFVLPFSEVIRLSLVILALAPIATLSTINMVKYDSKEEVSGFLSSSTIILSLVLITLVLSFII